MSRISSEPQSALTLPDLLSHPTIRGKTGAQQWYRDVLGVDVKYNAINKAAGSGDLPSFMVSGALWFATQDLYDFLMSFRRSVSDPSRSSQGVSA